MHGATPASLPVEPDQEDEEDDDAQDEQEARARVKLETILARHRKIMTDGVLSPTIGSVIKKAEYQNHFE